MRREWRLAYSLVILAMVFGYGISAADGQRRSEVASRDLSDDLGPEMTEFMTFLDAELAELTHLHDVGEVRAVDFRVSRDRLAATREAAIRIARARNEDRVPDLYVLVDKELTQILPSGAAAIRGKKAGDRVGDDFVFHGRIRRGVSFNILERTGGIPRAAP